MRILMLAQFYLPTIGGEERHVRDLSYELARRGHEVAIATLWRSGLPEFEDDHGIRIYRIHSTTQRLDRLYIDKERRHAPPFPDPETVAGLLSVIRKERPDIIHAHNWFLYSYLPLHRFSHARLVVTLHDYSLVCATKRLVRNDAVCCGPQLNKCLACSEQHYGKLKGAVTALGMRASAPAERSAVDMFIAVSQATAAGNHLEASGVPYQVIPNFVPDNTAVTGMADSASDAGVDVQHDPRLQQLPDDGFLLFVGDIAKDKGAHILLDAYAGLKEAPPLVMIGRLGLDVPAKTQPGVRFLGAWPHHLVMEAWRRSCIGLAPSTWSEPFGIVAIEAMAAGRPVIASCIGGLTDIVDDRLNGLLVPPGDTDALRKAMQSLIDQPVLRQRMGRAAKLKVTDYYASKVVSKIERVYESLLSTHAGIGD